MTNRYDLGGTIFEAEQNEVTMQGSRVTLTPTEQAATRRLCSLRGYPCGRSPGRRIGAPAGHPW
jgi:hypothetical protein